MTTPIDTIQLLPSYDVPRLQAEVRALGSDRYRRQSSFKGGGIFEYPKDGWHVLSLRSAAGDPARTDPGPSDLLDFLDTPLMDETPYIASVLTALRLPLRAVRLMSLEPGQSVEEHRDGCGLPRGWVRLHLPITTNSEAVIVLADREHRWQPGELWYADFGGLHSVRNNGTQARVHLVIDSFVDASFLNLVPPDVLPYIDQSEILFHRAKQPISPETLDTLTGSISIPAAFFGPQTDLVEDLLAGLEPDREGELRVDDGELFFVAGEQFRISLVHIGSLEFRLGGRSECQYIKLTASHGARLIHYRRRYGSAQSEVVREY